MGIIQKIKKWYIRKYWWVGTFKKEQLTDKEILSGRCLICHGYMPINPRNGFARCTEKEYECPCKYNQRLVCR